MDNVGVYKGRAVKRANGSWAQYGDRENGNLELILDLAIQIGEGAPVRRSYAEYINEKTIEYVIERLRALGWKGSDISNLDGIGDKEVDVEVFHETYENKTRVKYRILTEGGGRFSVERPADPKMFQAKFAALMGSMGAGGSTPNGGGAPPPPF
jgi:hypothetical protein